jgi:hypothetical protein
MISSVVLLWFHRIVWGFHPEIKLRPLAAGRQGGGNDR